MVSAYANSKALVVILSVLLLSWGTFANFTPAHAVLNCDGYVATIVGTFGDDLIEGTAGDDVILGLEGNDVINGNGGNDVICSGPGNDVVTTGSGDDQIHGEGGSDTFHAGDGNNKIDADFGASGDVITTGSGDDYILLGIGSDIVDSGDGHDKIIAGGGDDYIQAKGGDDYIYGGDGADTIDAGEGANYIEGNQKTDKITSGSGDDKIYGGDGADTINAGNGNNIIEGNQDSDVITSGSGDDDILGGHGADIINAGDGNNHVHGDEDNDIILTGSGDDDIDGNDGNDCINSGGGTDTIDGGSGVNSINVGDCKSGPSASILTPSDGFSVVTGTSITFSGTAVDAEDGDLGASLEWSSDLDGVIGTGMSFDLSTLSVGIHTITASVKDSEDSLGSSSQTVIIISADTPSISITEPVDGLISVDSTPITFSGTAVDAEDGDLGASLEWSSDLDGVIGTGVSFDLSTLSVGIHTITASVKDSDSKTNSVSIKLTINAEKDELVMVCHLPPGNPTNHQTLLISSSALQSHIDHGDVEGKCNDKNSEKKLVEQIVKKQREEMDKKNELKEKRNELKEIKKEIKQIEKKIKNEIKDLKKTVKEDPELKDKIKELISEIKETLKNLKEDHAYDKEHKEELKAEFKELKEKIQDDLTKPEKNAVHSVDSKISILSHSDDPKNDAKKLGLKYIDGLTTIAIKLTDDNQKVLQQLNSISNIEVKNDKNVQITINLKDLPKLQKLSGIENIRPPSSAIQFEELVSEGVYFMNADLAQYSGITGKGVKVAVFDLSFANNPKISENIVEVKSFRSGVSAMPSFWGGDEALHGTAVAEIITDVAPDVELYLYSMETDIEFTAAVDEAISKNIDIIAMSAGWPNFPTDGTSHITKKIEDAVENGIVFVVPAGNFGNKHWEGNFADSNLNGWHDFSASDEGLSITVTASRIADNEPIMAYLMWDVGQYDIADFELVLVNPLGEIVDFSANKQEVNSDTNLEHIYHIPDTEGIYSLGVLYSGDMESPDNRPKASLEIFTVNDKLEYPVPKSSVSVPADAKGAIVVGAVNHLDGTLAPYSSHGPTNNGKIAPHVVGPDGVTTLALDGKPFYGTSATTPYVAGLAALILEQNPEFSPSQLLTEIEQNTEQSKSSLKHEYDFATGYGTASAIFLIQDLEVLQ
ncbi:MAG TPA: S8 family serine peptidase [Nitrosopumilaceae archaeon]|nr:S8 family serine peptidase [Nitrosopumilaceae archaeon]